MVLVMICSPEHLWGPHLMGCVNQAGCGRGCAVLFWGKWYRYACGSRPTASPKHLDLRGRSTGQVHVCHGMGSGKGRGIWHLGTFSSVWGLRVSCHTPLPLPSQARASPCPIPLSCAPPVLYPVLRSPGLPTGASVCSCTLSVPTP